MCEHVTFNGFACEMDAERGLHGTALVLKGMKEGLQLKGLYKIRSKNSEAEWKPENGDRR